MYNHLLQIITIWLPEGSFIGIRALAGLPNIGVSPFCTMNFWILADLPWNPPPDFKQA